jgi:nucleoside-diphosphate-sugar epimerase
MNTAEREHAAATGASRRSRPVIVTGAAGFVGSHLVRALLHAGREVVATDAAATFPLDRLRGLDAERLRFLSADLLSPSLVAKLVASSRGPVDVVNVAAIINFGQLSAALRAGAAGPDAALQSFAVNASAAWSLCAGLAGAGVLGRFLHVSTRSVFGGRPATERLIDESTPPQPAGIYGSSKAAAEHGLLALRDELSLDLALARITGVFGPWQGPVSFIGRAVDDVIAGRPHRTPTGGDDAYELTYVKDTVRGLVQLIDAYRLAHPIYHVASGQRLIALREVAAAIAHADPAALVDFGPGAHAGSGGRTPLSISRAADEFGFATRWSLDDAIVDYLRIERGGAYGAEAADQPWLPN